jgi:hypothetical protein
VVINRGSQYPWDHQANHTNISSPDCVDGMYAILIFFMYMMYRYIFS